MANLTDTDLAMLREMARGRDTAGVEDFIARVQSRLDERAAAGLEITKNVIRSCATAELAA